MSKKSLSDSNRPSGARGFGSAPGGEAQAELTG